VGDGAAEGAAEGAADIAIRACANGGARRSGDRPRYALVRAAGAGFLGIAGLVAYNWAASSSDTVDMVSGRFWPGSMFVAATPCNDNRAPSSCPAPGFRANFLGLENMWTGAITPVTLAGPAFQPHSLIFMRG
jgi:hypothetical protein